MREKTNKKFETWDNVRASLLARSGVAKEYERLRPRYELISRLIEVRLESKLTQTEMAKRVGTKQSAISRFESGNYSPTIDFLEKVASAVGKELIITVK